MLFVGADELQRSKESCGLGYKNWFHNEMGNVLIDEGIRMATEMNLKKSVLKITTFLRLALAKMRVTRLKKIKSQVFNAPSTPTPTH